MKKVSPIDVNDQELMVKENLHPNFGFKRDPKLWSEQDKKKLQKLKARLGHQEWTAGLSYEVIPQRSIPVPGKLVVYAKGLPAKSFQCQQHDIPRILNTFRTSNNYINKYSWNNTTYEANELPFWKPKVKNAPAKSLRG